MVCQLHVNKERLHWQLYFTQKGGLGGGVGCGGGLNPAIFIEVPVPSGHVSFSVKDIDFVTVSTILRLEFEAFLMVWNCCFSLDQ